MPAADKTVCLLQVDVLRVFVSISCHRHLKTPEHLHGTCVWTAMEWEHYGWTRSFWHIPTTRSIAWHPHHGHENIKNKHGHMDQDGARMHNDTRRHLQMQ